MTDPTQHLPHKPIIAPATNAETVRPDAAELTGEAFKAAAEKAQRIIAEKQDEGDNNSDTTLQAGEHAFSAAAVKLASDRRDNSRAPARANEATDPNDTGSGGLPAGGTKGGSTIQ